MTDIQTDGPRYGIICRNGRHYRFQRCRLKVLLPSLTNDYLGAAVIKAVSQYCVNSDDRIFHTKSDKRFKPSDTRSDCV